MALCLLHIELTAKNMNKLGYKVQLNYTAVDHSLRINHPPENEGVLVCHLCESCTSWFLFKVQVLSLC